jgi:hypothetical protein
VPNQTHIYHKLFKKTKNHLHKSQALNINISTRTITQREGQAHER